MNYCNIDKIRQGKYFDIEINEIDENVDLDKLTDDTFMYFVIPYLFLILLLFTGRFIYFKIKRRNNSIQISYPEGIVSKIFPGMSILEASLDAGIPHAHVCGGRGRCSTCRIRIDQGLDQLEPARQNERRARYMSTAARGRGEVEARDAEVVEWQVASEGDGPNFSTATI